MLLMAWTAQAQNSIKVVPTMKKGDVRTYEIEVSSNIPDSPVKMAQQSVYTVVDANSNGYVMDITYKEWTTNGESAGLVGKLMSMSESMMQNAHMRLATDKQGLPVKILNYDEMRKQMEETVAKIIDEVKQSAPEMGELMRWDNLAKEAVAQMDESVILHNMLINSPLMLNGKTLSTGSEEEYVAPGGMKMKRHYTVNGRTIVAKSELNMSEDDLKNYIISQVEKAMPSQAEMIKQNIDMVMQSGMMKIEMTEDTTYELQDDGWVKSIKTVMNNKMMGKDIRTVSTVTMK
jgi:arsenate reductase-like glutaredoxin family protein